MIEAGTVLQNRYRVEKQIGQGGMGNVYVATDERFKSTVAIKETIFEDANLRKAFEREARLLNSLKHTALPRVSDHFDENDGQFLVMEFIAGDDLAAMMEKNGAAFPLETVLNWAHQLCNALEYLHAQNIIHRDIKPQNLKLTPKSEIVLLDFGLAKGGGNDAANQTAAKSIFGFSRNYASLEQIQGAGTEPRSDLYSLAATIYHLLTGIPPADALTRAMNVLNGKSDPLIQANLVNGKIPVEVAAILQKTMALNADERPSTAAEMRRMLDESDKTIDLSAVNSISDNILSAEFLTQDTRIIGAKTNLSANSEIKTKITANESAAQEINRTTIAEDDSESATTVLRPLAASSRKRSKAVVATLGIIFCGALLAAGFFLSSNQTLSNDGANDANGEKNNNFVADAPANSAMTNVDAPVADPQTAEKETKEQTVSVAPLQPVETNKQNAKNTKNQTSTARANTQNKEPDKIVVNDERIEMGDMIIDDNGIRDKKTGKIIFSEDGESGGLTTEQIKRLQRLGEGVKNRKNRVVVVKSPVPPPAPTVPPTPEQ